MSQEHDYHLSHGYSVWAAAALCLILVATGCKSGASFSKPSSWWAGGGSNDPSQLAAAPPFEEGATADGTVARPSSMASPYPTTTTPQGYAINDATANPQMPPATAQASAGQPPIYPSTDDAAPVT